MNPQSEHPQKIEWVLIDEQTGKVIPPMSEERYLEIIADIDDFNRQRAAWSAASSVRGKFNAEWSDEIARLKREGKLEDALALVYECMDAADRASQVGPRMGSTWGAWVIKAAIILRKMKDHDAEVRLLEEANLILGDHAGIASRLIAARRLLDKHPD